MSDKTMVITSASGVIITTDNKSIALSFWHDGALVEYENNKGAVFGELVKHEANNPAPVYPVWLNEYEKNTLVAHWEKTGMFGSIVQKIRSTESLKKTK